MIVARCKANRASEVQLADYLYVSGLCRSRKEARILLAKTFEKIKKLSLDEGRTVFIGDFGKFLPRRLRNSSKKKEDGVALAFVRAPASKRTLDEIGYEPPEPQKWGGG